MKIIQQTTTFLHLGDRKLDKFFGAIAGTGFIMGFLIWRLGVSYGESQYLQLKCEAVSSTRSEPCTLKNDQPFTVHVESEPIKRTKLEHTLDENQNIAKSKLILVTEKGDYEIPNLNNQEVNSYSQQIEKMLKEGRILGTRLDGLTIEQDTRTNSLIWCVVWGLPTLLLGYFLILAILHTPTSISWKFDRSNDSVTGEFYQFFRRIYQDKVSLNQIRELQWTSDTRISRDDDGNETRKVTFCINLLLRSGEVIPLIPHMWSDYWQAEDVERFALMIGRFLDVEEPKVSEIAPVRLELAYSQKQMLEQQEQIRLKKQRLDRS